MGSLGERVLLYLVRVISLFTTPPFNTQLENMREPRPRPKYRQGIGIDLITQYFFLILFILKIVAFFSRREKR